MLLPIRDNTAAARTWVARPLSADELGEAERVAARLSSEFRRIVSALPTHARHASGMARHLGVLRATCQRAVHAIQDESVQMLGKLPGVEGLKQLLEGFRRVGVDSADLGTAESAIESFERLIASTGGSQTRLIERLNLKAAPGGAAEEGGLGTVAQRRDLFQAAARVTGRRCQTSLSIYAFRQSPTDPAVLERGLAKGVIGSVIVPGGLPMVLSSGDTLKTDDELDVRSIEGPQLLKGRTPEAILKPFTTDPLPMVTSHDRAGTLFQIIDPKSLDGAGPVDVVTALRASAPMLGPGGKPTLDAVWSLVSCPSERLVLDVYLHVEMERHFRPSLDALLWSASLDIAQAHKWALRLPSQPRLVLLGRGLSNSASELYARHKELSGYFFEHIGWDADEFIGFRCEVVYPVWRAGYCMAFEHLPTEASRDGEVK